MDRIADAAAMLAAARLSGQPVEPLPVIMRPRDEAEAYWIQNAVHRLIARSRYGVLTGYSVGGSSEAEQRYLGIKRPCSGGLFAGTMRHSGVKLSFDDYQRMGMDCEIAVRLSKDLTAAEGPFDYATVADAVECYMPAVQIVDDRYADWRRIDLPTLIADDFFGAAAVVGSPVPAAQVRDPLGLTGEATVNGRPIGSGSGVDLMGHPLNVLAWLANAMIGRGEQLRAGETIFLGALFPTRWLDVGDEVVFSVSGLGRVEFSVIE
jgi:2-keto-4-pentenoate hydratase